MTPELTSRALTMAATSHVLDPEVMARHLDAPAIDVVTTVMPHVLTEQHDGQPRWVLKPDLRRRLLADFVPGRAALPAAASTVETAYEQLLREWLGGRLTDVPQAVARRPEPLRKVASWLVDCWRVEPRPRDVLRRLGLGELRAKYRRTVTETFLGRKDELHRLGDLTSRPPFVAVVEAPGGIGKSALIAEFLLDAGGYGDAPDAPLAAVLDFDDPGLTPARPDLLYRELSRQLAIQDERFEAFEAEMGANTSGLESLIEGASDDGGEVDDYRTESLARSLFHALRASRRRFLVALDTLERPRPTMPAALERFLAGLLDRADEARADGADVAVIVAGRGPIVSDALARRGARTLPLGPLKRKFAARLLLRLGVVPALVQPILDRFEAAPLTLRLAAQALAAGATEVLEPDAAVEQIRRARGAGYLQLRILDHLPSQRLAAVARRALLLRTITVERLATIVGPLVDPPVGDDEATRLFDELSRVTELVTFKAGEAHALVLHEQVAGDIAELSAVLDPALVRALRTRAIEALAGSDAVADRDELALHQAWLAALDAPGPVTVPVLATAGARPDEPSLASVQAAFAELVSGNRLTEALELIEANEVAYADAALLLAACAVARRLRAPDRAGRFAEHALEVVTSASERALAASQLAWAMTAGGLSGADQRRRRDELRAEARRAWDEGAAEERSVARRVAVLLELAEDDPGWARGQLGELFAGRGVAALADLDRELLRRVGAQLGSHQILDWAAKLGAFDGEGPRGVPLGPLARAVVTAGVDGANDPQAVEHELASAARAGRLGDHVQRLLAGLRGADESAAGRVLGELAELLDQLSSVPRARDARDPVVRGRAHDLLARRLIDVLSVEDLRGLAADLGDRDIARRANPDNLDLAVRSTLVAVDRRRRGGDFVRLLSDRGLGGEAALAREAFDPGGDDDDVY